VSASDGELHWLYALFRHQTEQPRVVVFSSLTLMHVILVRHLDIVEQKSVSVIHRTPPPQVRRPSEPLCPLSFAERQLPCEDELFGHLGVEPNAERIVSAARRCPLADQ